MLAAGHARLGRVDEFSGGSRRIPIETPSGPQWVWTRRVGAGIPLLLLHGGPGATHEYFECFDSYLPAAGIEVIHYDQLGSAYSAQPDDPSLWDLDRFVDEVEQVRVALGLTDFFLLGHSWGGLLGMEYALAHQQHLAGLVISNMMSSGPAYDDYAQRVLVPQLDPADVTEIRQLEADGRHLEPRYEELLRPHYEAHVLRMPQAHWPDPVIRAFDHINSDIYVPMQGPSELGAAGMLASWDRSGDLGRITVPTLVIGAEHDTMDPAHMRWMSGQLPQGTHLHCPDGSHMCMYDDQQVYVRGLIEFLVR
jgi:proline iminopeptidase